MNSEEKFKKSLEELISSTEFSFTDSDWKVASKFLDTQKRKKRVAFYFLFGLMILISGVSTFLVLNNGETQLLVFETAKPIETEITKEKVYAPEKIKENKASEAKENQSNEIRRPVVTPKRDVTGDKPESINANTKQIIFAKVKETKIYPYLKTLTWEHNPQVTDQNPGITDKTDTRAIKETKLEESAFTGIADNSINKLEEPEKIQLEESKNIYSSVEKPWNAEISSKNNPADETRKIEMEPSRQIKLLEGSVAIAAPSSDSTNSRSSKRDSLENKMKLFEKADSTNSPYPYDLRDFNNPKTLLTLEAGTAYFFGWRNAVGREANGLSPLFGINYFNWLNQNSAISIGAQYYHIYNLSSSSFTSKVTRYSLGEENQVNIYTPGNLHYLSMPIKYNYGLNSKNTIGIGLNVAYLLEVESKVESYYERLNRREDYVVGKTKGYVEGFKNFDTQLTASYRRKIYKNFSLNAELFFGLTDIKDNNFFKTNLAERNTGLKLTVVYSIFRKVK